MGLIQRILGKDTVTTHISDPLNDPAFNDNTEDDVLKSGQFFEKRIRGKITRVDERGFGFITSKEIPFTRIFFHWSGLLQSTRNFKDLDKGLIVEFNPFLVEDKGYRALKIAVVDNLNEENDE